MRKIQEAQLLDMFMVRVVAPILRLYLHPRVEGLRNVPPSGRLIVASNHLSFIDSFVVALAVLPRRVTFIAKAEYFEGGGAGYSDYASEGPMLVAHGRRYASRQRS